MAQEMYDLKPMNPNVPQKITNWKNEPALSDLKNDAELAKPQHDAQMAKIVEWNNLLKVEGSARPKKVKGRSSVQPKLIRRQAEWRYSALTEPFLSSQKLFKVSPVTYEDEDASKQNELVLNWQFRTKLNKVSFIDNLVRSVVDDGTAIVRLGWERETTMVKEMAPVYEYYAIETQEEMDAFEQALAAREENIRGFEEQASPEVLEAVNYFLEVQTPVVAVQVGEEEVEVEKVLVNRPTAVVMNPQNVSIDPSCNGDFTKALFAICSFETNQSELKKSNVKYKNLDRIRWEDSTPLSEPDHETKTPDSFNFRDAARKKVVAYEYWGYYDIHGNDRLVPIVCTWIGDVIIRMEESPFPDKKIPFVLIPYMPKKRDLYGETDAELLKENQQILGATYRGMIDLMGRSANGQQGIAKGMLDPMNRRRFEDGQNYEFNPGLTPAQGYFEHKFPELPQSGLTVMQMQNQEAEALTGVKAFGGGLSGSAYGDVATGVRGMLDAAAKREMAILRRLAQGMQEIGNKIISMNAEFMSDKEVIRITNKEFVTVKRDDLVGQFDLEVDIATTEVDNMKAQDLGFMLQTLGPNMSPEITMMILSEIASLKRMPALAEKLKKYRPEPDPMQVELQQIELEKAKKELEKLDSEIQYNIARAAQASAAADGADIDNQNEANGTNHRQSMEALAEQGQSNQRLQMMKAITTPTKEGEKKPDIQEALGLNQLSAIMAGQSKVTSPIERDLAAGRQPQLNIRSPQFVPEQDPALNPAFNI